MSDVYCDNEQLKKYILDAKLSKNGLYPHELVMLFYAKIGQFTTANTVFAGLFSYQFKVEQPGLMLQSLINRGYIRNCSPEELPDYLKTAKMRELLKSKNIKCKSSREELAKAIRENFAPEEVVNACGYFYYIPTDKGITELLNNEYIAQDPYKGWELNHGYENKHFLQPTDIHIVDTSKREILVTKNPCSFSIGIHSTGYEIIKSWVQDYPSNTHITVVEDGHILCKDVIANRIYFMRNIRKMVLCHRVSDNSIICCGYDLERELLIFKEEIKNYFCSNMPEDQYEYSQLVNSLEGIIENNNINYFLSVQNMLAYLILSECLKEKVILKKLNNYLDNDNSLNYCITVPLTNDYARNIIMYMVSDGMLACPVIKGVPMYTVMDYLRKSSPSKTHKALMDDEILSHEYECSVVSEVKKAISSDWKQVFTIITKTYPKRVFQYSILEVYSCDNYYQKDENRNEVYNNRNKWHTEFMDLVQQLIVNGVINPRWINEFSLYMIANAFYDDAVYQYHCAWLDQQSLDIYIPSEKIGIEYQGRQHYEAIGFFGGDANFEKRQELDERKWNLCKHNNVRLVEWPHTLEVTVQKFSEMLKGIGINKTINDNAKLNAYQQAREKIAIRGNNILD